MKSPSLLAVILAFALCSCSASNERFTVGRLPEDGSTVLSSKTLGSVYVNQYAGNPEAGLAVMVLHAKTKSPILEALDTDGDGYWDTVRYVVQSNGKTLRVEDDKGNGAPRVVEVKD